jgi:cell division septal protein FtsQ
VLIFLFSAGAAVYFFVWSPFWRLQKIEISGTSRADLVNELKLSIKRFSQGYYYGVLPKDNLWLMRTGALSTKIRKNLWLEKVKIEKKYPRGLLINVAEKRPVAIWHAGQIYYYIDKAGKAISAKKLSEIEYDLPRIESQSEKVITIGRRVIDTKRLSYLLAAIKGCQSIADDWYIEKVVLPDGHPKDLYFYSSQGWYFILNVDSPISSAMDNLKLFLRSKGQQAKKLKYIDLRFTDRLFYQ